MSLLGKSINGFVGAFFLVAAFALASTGVVAQQAQGGEAFCTALLSEHPEGGQGLVSEVKNLVAAAPDVAGDIIGCAAGASKAQSSAIGSGLSKAVAGLKNTNPELADKIAALVAGSDNSQLVAGYSGGEAEEATAAIDDGGAGAGDGGSAPGGAPGFGGGPAAPVLTVGSSGSGTGGGTVSPN